MKFSFFNQAAVIGAAAFALASATAARAEWTQFTAAQRQSFSFTHAHHPDGRFLFGTAGTVRSQGTFGVNAFTTVSNSATRFFDPAFIAVRGATSALIGGGGFLTNNGLFPFNPAVPATDIGVSLTTVNPNAYAAVWWQHPSSGRQGWLFTGTNASGQNNLTFLSDDGTVTGPVTAALSSYSGGIAVNADGDVFTLLADSDANFIPTAFDNQLLKYTAAQIDAAVAAIIATSPAPLQRADAAVLFTADASGSLAIDSQNRAWIGGYQISHIQLWDPANEVTRRVVPLDDVPENYDGRPSYSVRSFTQAATPRVSFLANDGFYAADSDLVLGHAAEADIKSRSVQITNAPLTVTESDTGVISLTISITPAPTTETTVNVAFSGTAVPNQDYTFTQQTTTIAPGQATATLWTLQPINNTRREGNRTITVTLAHPTDDDSFGLGALGSETVTFNLIDDDVPPVIATAQAFPAIIRVGSSFNYQVQTTGLGIATKWSATGLPPGLKIDPLTGIISGTPTTSGDFDRVVITASNAQGKSTSMVYLLTVAPLTPATIGKFSGLFDRFGSTTGGLGGRFDLVTTAKGAFTATATVGKKKHVTRGTLDSSGVAPTGTISVDGNAIQFFINAVTGEINGNAPVVIGALSSELTGWAHLPQFDRVGTFNFAALASSPPAGLPQGASFGTIKISAKGLARISGRTADGSAFGTSTALGRDGQLLVYQALYKVPGTFMGRINLLSNASQTLIGSVTWSKPAQTSGALYRAGWNPVLPLTILGGRYRPVAGATLPLDADITGGVNASVALSDGGLEDFGPASISFGVQIASITRVIAPAPLKLTLNNKTGVIGGRLPLANGSDRRTAVFNGLLIPTSAVNAPYETRGLGHFTLPTAVRGTSRTGLLSVEP